MVEWLINGILNTEAFAKIRTRVTAIRNQNIASGIHNPAAGAKPRSHGFYLAVHGSLAPRDAFSSGGLPEERRVKDAIACTSGALSGRAGATADREGVECAGGVDVSPRAKPGAYRFFVMKASRVSFAPLFLLKVYKTLPEAA
jgi:hypothetical protein